MQTTTSELATFLEQAIMVEFMKSKAISEKLPDTFPLKNAYFSREVSPLMTTEDLIGVWKRYSGKKQLCGC